MRSHEARAGAEWTGGRRPAWSFAVRWAAAVALGMLVAGAVEHALAAGQLERRTLEEAANGYAADLRGTAEVLASGLPPAARRDALSAELRRVGQTYGTKAVILFSADGAVVQAIGAAPDEDKSAAVRAVLASGTASWDKERDEGEAGGENRYEFLLPLSTSGEPSFVVEVDQEADIVERMLADLRLRKAYALGVGLLIAVPLSYLLGGVSLHRRQRRAERAADTDALTGLGSRRPFRPALQQALDGPAGTVLALIDLDDFKGVNDRLGHSYGDRVLCDMAGAFGALRASDAAFRLGGDEFAVVLPATSEGQALAAVERVRSELAERVPGVTFSCGVAVADGTDGVDQQELWERADAALYEAKRRGRRQTVCFAAMLDGPGTSAVKLDALTALLVEGSDLRVAFQPVWDLQGDRVLGHEALLRLPADSPITGVDEAFALARRMGLAAELDARARAVALHAVRRQPDWSGLLFLNVHPDAVPDLDLEGLVVELATAGLAPAAVILEITEHDGIDQPTSVRTLERAQEQGFRLALDDMGAGNAGLRALATVAFDVIKLDRQVTARLGRDAAADAVAAAAFTFMQQTGGWVVAEGIEDVDMLDAVVGGIVRPHASVPTVAGQGYLLGRPAPGPLLPDSRIALHAPTASAPLGG